jgi:hypothetical protein
MDRADQRQREEPAAERLDQAPDRVATAADDRLAGRVDDQQVGAIGAAEGRADLVGRARDDAGHPVDRLPLGDPPEAAGGLARAGQLGAEQRGRVEPPEHLVAPGPGPQRQQARRLAEAVADRGPGGHAAAAEPVRDDGPQRDLAQDRRPVVGERRGRVGIPEQPRRHLAVEEPVLPVERPEDLRPVRRQFAPPSPANPLPRPGKTKARPASGPLSPRVRARSLSLPATGPSGPLSPG